MNDHEIWNELGNLYLLSGFYNQAVHAYNKAIQLESDYGKPYCNLALIYAKQAKHEDAIQLFKKSLGLLTDDVEKAITWNRLGNVYRQLKEYQEAVYAYHCADDLMPNEDENNGQPSQMLYVSLESESLLYEMVEEQHDIQSHYSDFTLDVEPEFDETFPGWMPVEAELLVNETHSDQNNQNVLVSEYIAGPVPTLRVEDVETPVPVSPANESFTPPESNPVEENSQVESDAETLAEPEEQITPENLLNKEVVQVPDNGAFSNASQTKEDIGTVSDGLAPTTLEASNLPEGEEYNTDSEFIKPIAQAEEGIEALPEELVQTVLETNILPDESVSEIDSEFAPTIALAEDEADLKEEHDSDLPSSFPSIDKAQQTVNDDVIGTEKEICVEEEKLAKQIEINPRSATTWEALGTLYKTAGRYEEAIQAFEQAISIAPREVSYHHNLGLVYAAQGNNKDAYNTFQKVLELDPNHSLTHASLGGYYKKMGLDELAQKHIGKAMKHIYESENEYNRACLDAICGNIDQAIELLHIALENKQTYVDWVLNDPDLEPLREDERFKQLIADFSK